MPRGSLASWYSTASRRLDSRERTSGFASRQPREHLQLHEEPPVGVLAGALLANVDAGSLGRAHPTLRACASRDADPGAAAPIWISGSWPRRARRSSAPRSLRDCHVGTISAVQLLGAGAAPQRTAQIGPLLRVQTEIPHAVRGEAAAVAVRAERRGRRGDDAEHGAVGQPEAIGRRRDVSSRQARSARSARSRTLEHLAARRPPGPSTSGSRRPRPCTR